MHMHPDAYLQMVEQDRERAMTQRALQRAAREGGTQQPGLVWGGIIGFAHVLSRVGSAAASLFPGGADGASPVAGASAH